MGEEERKRPEDVIWVAIHFFSVNLHSFALSLSLLTIVVNFESYGDFGHYYINYDILKFDVVAEK